MKVKTQKPMVGGKAGNKKQETRTKEKETSHKKQKDAFGKTGDKSKERCKMWDVKSEVGITKNYLTMNKELAIC